jgi:seryl-tRNA synthetase
MLDIQFIRENKELVQKAAKNKNIDIDIDELLALDEKRREIQRKGDELRTRKNEIAEALKDDAQRTPEMIEEGKKIKDELAALENNEITTAFQELMLKVPNIPSNDTPIGPDESSNEEVKVVGEIPQFDFEIKDHIELGTSLNILDLERGVKVSGFRGYILKNEGAQMHFALLQYVFNKLISKGFSPMTAPAIVREEALMGMGQFPAHKAEVFTLATSEGEEPKYLAGTAEVGLLGQFSDEIVQKSELPLKLVGFSPCYRSEAGSHGKDTKGLYRVHEFMKVEQLIIAEADMGKGFELHEELLAISEEILQDLKIPYHVIITATGDQGQGKVKMYDIESWMPARGKYGETHSNSFLSDWQARRANIRYKDGNEMKYVYTLNNTAIALPRVLVALWENYQNADGSVSIPEVLVPYMQGITKIEKK